MYIITEDSNSARDFWQCVAQTFRSVDSFLLVSFPIGSDGQTASGNTTLKAQVLSIFPKLQAGDKVFVAVDCVANNTKGFIAHDFVKWGTRLCMKKGAEFVATSYWCFEDLYLSYDEVLAMYLKNPVAENVVIAALQYVHDNLQNGTDYFDTSREIQNFIDLHNSAGKNREHFANELLMEVTRALKGNGHFAITKSVGAFRKSAECWLRDCSDIKENMAQQQVINICDKKCEYCCKDKGTVDKLIDLDTRSICKDSGYRLQQMCTRALVQAAIWCGSSACPSCSCTSSSAASCCCCS